MTKLLWILAAAAVLMVGGCSHDRGPDADANGFDIDEQSDAEESGQGDSGGDASSGDADDLDTGTDTDANSDTGANSDTDTGAENDTGADVGTDTGTDAGSGASCGGFVGDDLCLEDEFCLYEREDDVSTCMSNGIGQCTTMPTDCPDEVEPVCGCNGQTYDNECLAHADGVDVYTTGPCQL